MDAVEQAPTAEPTADLNAGPVEFGAELDSFFNTVQAPAEEPVVPVKELADEPPGNEPASKEETPAGDEPADPSEADPLEEVKDPDVKDWTPQAARAFKEVKAEAKALKARAAELESELQQREARLQELEALANDPKVKDVTERAEEYEQAMILRNLESSSAYKQLVKEPLNRIVTEMDAIAEKYSIDPDTLVEVSVMEDEAAQDERLEELLVNASLRDRSRIYNLIEQTKPILEQRRALHENAQEALREAEAIEQENRQAELAERARTRLEAASAVVKRMESKMPFLTTLDGVDLKALAAEVGKMDPGSLNPALASYHMMAGKLFPTLANAYLGMRFEVEKLTDRLADYDRAGSPLNGGTAAGNEPGSDDEPFEASLNRKLAGVFGS